jgi:hypothetical protein
MVPRILAAVLALAVSGPSNPLTIADEPKKDDPRAVSDLVLEISALRTLYYLKTTPEQARALLELAKETAGKAHERKAPKISKEYGQLLADLRDALADDDEETVESLEDQLEELTITETPELDDDVPITDAARKRAPQVLQQYKVNQLATFIGAHAEETVDPLEALISGLEHVRDLGLVEWKETRDELSEKLSVLVAGVDQKKAEKVREDTIEVLARARTLKADEFTAQKEKLEGEARRIVGKVDPMEVLRHKVEHALAQMLSNPRVEAALKARAK